MTEYRSGPGGGLFTETGAKSVANAMLEMTITMERKPGTQRGFCIGIKRARLL
jgi:hypothetical protein